jgi:hypothetical protein
MPAEQEYIPFSQEEKDEFYERLGSAHFKLQGHVNREYSKHIIDIYFKSVGFAATVVSTVGIIAGFGFTAFSFIESPLLFFSGEALLLYSIIHGLIWIQNIYIGEFNSLDKAHTAHQKYFSERNEKFKSVWNDISTTDKVKKTDFLEFIDTNNNAIQLFVPSDEVTRKQKVIFSKKQYYLLVAGAICLLGSFFIYTFINIILCALLSLNVLIAR